MILYPTETIYALGALALDDAAIERLYAIKGREVGKPVSWLVRDISDIQAYAIVSDLAMSIAQKFLPGPLTLVLPAKEFVPDRFISPDKTIGFRISSDTLAQRLIEQVMRKYNMPLTCTSANVSGNPTLSLPADILLQLGECCRDVQVIDGGERAGVASTVVRVIGEEIVVLREGVISSAILRG